jgi:hypothetical protein
MGTKSVPFCSYPQSALPWGYLLPAAGLFRAFIAQSLLRLVEAAIEIIPVVGHGASMPMRYRTVAGFSFP